MEHVILHYWMDMSEWAKEIYEKNLIPETQGQRKNYPRSSHPTTYLFIKGASLLVNINFWVFQKSYS